MVLRTLRIRHQKLTWCPKILKFYQTFTCEYIHTHKRWRLCRHFFVWNMFWVVVYKLQKIIQFIETKIKLVTFYIQLNFCYRMCSVAHHFKIKNSLFLSCPNVNWQLSFGIYCRARERHFAFCPKISINDCKLFQFKFVKNFHRFLFFVILIKVSFKRGKFYDILFFRRVWKNRFENLCFSISLLDVLIENL